MGAPRVGSRSSPSRAGGRIVLGGLSRARRTEEGVQQGGHARGARLRPPVVEPRDNFEVTGPTAAAAASRPAVTYLVARLGILDDFCAYPIDVGFSNNLTGFL